MVYSEPTAKYQNSTLKYVMTAFYQILSNPPITILLSVFYITSPLQVTEHH